MRGKNQIKYFVQGVPFSLFGMNLLIIWSSMWLVLRFLGSSAGTYLGIVALFLIVGGVNAAISGGIDAIVPLRLQRIIPSALRRVLSWRFWFTMKRSIFRVLVQGIILAVLITVINFLFVTLANIIYPGPYIFIPSFIITTYLDGYLCKNTAGSLRGIED